MGKHLLSGLAAIIVAVVLAGADARADDAPPPPKLAAQAYSDWVYRCQEGPEGAACEVAQQMIVHQGDKVVPVLTIAFARAGAAQKGHVVSILAPLGVVLKQGVSVSADDGKPLPFEFRFCDQRGCLVSVERGDPLLAALKQGKTGHAKLMLLDGRSLTVDFSLAGLGLALDALASGKLPPPVAPAPAPASPPADAPAAGTKPAS